MSENKTVVELCAHCGCEIEMQWDVEERGLKAFCPACGKVLMLCDECMHREREHYCGKCDEQSKATLLDETTALTLLDRMEQFRRHHQNEHIDPADYCMRVLSAIIAEAAGMKERAKWTEKLRQMPDSLYSKDYKDGAVYNW